ncbi:hypothetical protein AAFF_G00159250 [Aldrovandia affinis]|uniref:Uncharacterized protein n=1 Tax=Aldrovandia affinis TaxID=143900 RepID=A0AAD7W7L4_9TELE|nr:hypothetical protein AAFF_G00159250 [Aldrovandia affinis]
MSSPPGGYWGIPWIKVFRRCCSSLLAVLLRSRRETDVTGPTRMASPHPPAPPMTELMSTAPSRTQQQKEEDEEDEEQGEKFEFDDSDEGESAPGSSVVKDGSAGTAVEIVHASDAKEKQAPHNNMVVTSALPDPAAKLPSASNGVPPAGQEDHSANTALPSNSSDVAVTETAKG